MDGCSRFPVAHASGSGCAVERGDALRVADVCARVADAEGLTPDDLSEMTRGGHRTRLKDRVSWSVTHFLYAGPVERVRNAVPEFLERSVVDLLIAMGYGGGDATMGRMTGRSGDGGIDGAISGHSVTSVRSSIMRAVSI